MENLAEKLQKVTKTLTKSPFLDNNLKNKIQDNAVILTMECDSKEKDSVAIQMPSTMEKCQKTLFNLGKHQKELDIVKAQLQHSSPSFMKYVAQSFPFLGTTGYLLWYPYVMLSGPLFYLNLAMASVGFYFLVKGFRCLYENKKNGGAKAELYKAIDQVKSLSTDFHKLKFSDYLKERLAKP